MSFTPQQASAHGYVITNSSTVNDYAAWSTALTDSNINTSLRIDPNNVLIGNQTLGEILRDIHEHIALITPVLELHAEYPELKELYEQYNKKLAQIQEKQQLWNTLNK